MEAMPQDEYVLGTYDEEVDRLGLQHRVWRSWVTDLWKRAGVNVGQQVLDVGAGPGYAAVDLAQLVGPTGRVVAAELSDRFVDIGRDRAATQGLDNVEYRQMDLVLEELGPDKFDVAWCRWVLSFVSDPGKVVKKVAESLQPGALFLIHEYLEYSTWTFMPPQPQQSDFCALTIKNWKDAGGDPNIGMRLPQLLSDAGLVVREARPVLFTIRPSDYAWQWPLAWIKSSSKRLVETGDMTKPQADQLLHEFETMGQDPGSIMLSPSVIEIIAERTT